MATEERALSLAASLTVISVTAPLTAPDGRTDPVARQLSKLADEMFPDPRLAPTSSAADGWESDQPTLF